MDNELPWRRDPKQGTIQDQGKHQHSNQAQRFLGALQTRLGLVHHDKPIPPHPVDPFRAAMTGTVIVAITSTVIMILFVFHAVYLQRKMLTSANRQLQKSSEKSSSSSSEDGAFWRVVLLLEYPIIFANSHAKKDGFLLDRFDLAHLFLSFVVVVVVVVLIVQTTLPSMNRGKS
jgi:hypothetical protein